MTITIERQLGRRERRRNRIMREVQEIAVRRFTADGFDAVTVEEIAAEADVAPITIYRHFGTKERLVLWDEFDPPILEEIALRLPSERPLRAVCDALAALLSQVYDREAPLALARAKLIHREPALLAAATFEQRAFAGAIAGLIELHGRGAFEARVLAEAAVAALGAAVHEWQAQNAATPLATLIGQAFDNLEGAA